MSKKINFATINETTVNNFSAYNVAFQTLKELRVEYNAKKNKIEEEMDKVREARKEAMDNGVSVDEATQKFPLEPCINALNRAKLEYEEACKPHNEAKKACMDMLDENLYFAYVKATEKGDLGAKGEVTIKKTTYTLEKSLKGYFVDFLDRIGASNQDNETAITKFAQIMSVRVGGVRKSNKDGYVCAKSKTQFNEIVMLCFLQYLVIEKGVLVQNEDYTLTKAIFEN